MTPETPYLPPPPVYAPQHPDRSGWLIAFGILEVLFGLFMWLMALFSAFVLTSTLKQRAAAGQPEVSIIPVLVMYGTLGAFWIVMGIASAMKKNWARLTLLVVSAIWAALGVVMTLSFAVFGSSIFQQAASRTPSADPSTWKFALVFMVTFSVIFMVALPLVFIFFYSRPSVKATCTSMVPGYRPSSRPLLMNILAGYYFFAAVGSFYSFFASHKVPVFGVVLPRPLTILFILIGIGVHVFGGWAFLKRVAAGWWTIAGYTVFNVLSAIVTFTVRNPMDVYREMEMPPQTLERLQGDPVLFVTILTFSIALQAAHLVALWWSKRYFTTEAPSSPLSFSESMSSAADSNAV